MLNSKVMQEMFEASVDGEAFDMDRWGQYFRPAGMAQRTGDPCCSRQQVLLHLHPAAEAAVPAPVAETAPEATPAPAAAEAAPAEGGNAQDILAMIRSRQGQ